MVVRAYESTRGSGYSVIYGVFIDKNSLELFREIALKSDLSVLSMRYASDAVDALRV